MSGLLPGEAVTCPDCGRRIGTWRGRIASHKTTVAKFVAAAGEDTVWTTARCNGSMRPVAVDLMAALRASLERARGTATGGETT